MYYSARAQYLCLVDDGKLRKRVLCDEQTFVFRAGDRRRAFAKALRLARANELSYSNAKGQTVRWALKQIVTLDSVGARLDAREITSRLFMADARQAFSFKSRFVPGKSKPQRTM